MLIHEATAMAKSGSTSTESTVLTFPSPMDDVSPLSSTSDVIPPTVDLIAMRAIAERRCALEEERAKREEARAKREEERANREEARAKREEARAKREEERAQRAIELQEAEFELMREMKALDRLKEERLSKESERKFELTIAVTKQNNLLMQQLLANKNN